MTGDAAEERYQRALEVSNEAQGWPIEQVLARANTALVEKDWILASVLFTQVMNKAGALAVHAVQLEATLFKGKQDGT